MCKSFAVQATNHPTTPCGPNPQGVFYRFTNAWAHTDLARDNIAMALADLVEIDYLGLEDAKEIACDWLFNNPNRFFKLGLGLQ
jgi:hypothetical protein